MRTEQYERAAPIAQEWDELADRVHAAPWLRPGWIEAWWRAFGKGRLQIVALRRDGRLAGVGAVAWKQGALVSPTNWHTPEFGFLAEDEEALSTVVDALLESSPRSVHLSFLSPGRSSVAEYRARAQARGYRTIERVVLRSPYVAIQGTWEDHAARLSRHMLKEINRCRRRLEERGDVVFELADGSDNLDRLIEEAFRVEGSGWKGEMGTAIAADSDVRQFYIDVASWAASRGILRIAFLRVAGKPIAFDFNIEDGGVCYALKGGYEEAYRKFGPGMMLTHEMLNYAFEKGLTRYEFVGADDPFKMAWTDTHHDRILLQAFAPSPSGFVEYAAFAYGRPLTKRVLDGVLQRRSSRLRLRTPAL